MGHGRTSLGLAALAVAVPLAVLAEWWLGRAGTRTFAGGLLLPPTIAWLALAHARRVLEMGPLLPRGERRVVRLAQGLAWLAAALLPTTIPVLITLFWPSRADGGAPPAIANDPRPYRAARKVAWIGIALAAIALALPIGRGRAIGAAALLILPATLAARQLRRGEESLTDAPPHAERRTAFTAFAIAALALLGCTAIAALQMLLPWVSSPDSP